MTDFVVAAAREAAERRIEEIQVSCVSVEDQRAFVEAMLDPPEPTPALRRAFRRHRALMTDLFVSGGFMIQVLGAHDRLGFSRGSVGLDRYPAEQARQDVKRLVARCFVGVDATTQVVAGYYMLAARRVPATDLPATTLKRLQRYLVLPAALIGRLAIGHDFQRGGLGRALLADAALRVVKGDTKAFALVVKAKDEAGVAFYRLQGFWSFASRPNLLFVLLATVRKAVLGAALGDISFCCSR